MQHHLTLTRDSRLLYAANIFETGGAGTGLALRASRLEIWQETDWSEVEEMSLVMDETLAQQYARTVTRARLTVPDDDGAWVAVIDEYDAILNVLRLIVPDLDSLEMVQAAPGELPVSEPGAAVVPCTWNGLWFRSRAEMRIAEALERQNVLFAANASVRLGITPDHREARESDFLICCEGKWGVLEVDGPWHKGRAADDHERDERFHEHGIRVVRRYPAERCSEMPDDIVARFLRLLRQLG